MHCPNCDSNNYVEGEVCTQCEGDSGASPVAELADNTAVEGALRILLEKYRSGRRNTIGGVLLLLGACLIVLALMSKGLPPFLAFLWTCCMFLWGAIALAEGCAEWLLSRSQIKPLAHGLSQLPGETGREAGAARRLQRVRRFRVREASAGFNDQFQRSSTRRGQVK